MPARRALKSAWFSKSTDVDESYQRSDETIEASCRQPATTCSGRNINGNVNLHCTRHFGGVLDEALMEGLEEVESGLKRIERGLYAQRAALMHRKRDEASLCMY